MSVNLTIARGNGRRRGWRTDFITRQNVTRLNTSMNRRPLAKIRLETNFSELRQKRIPEQNFQQQLLAKNKRRLSGGFTPELHFPPSLTQCASLTIELVTGFAHKNFKIWIFRSKIGENLIYIRFLF